jgi:retinoid hydroxylase
MPTVIENNINSLPGKLGLPLIGESIEWLLDPNFFQKRHAKYGNIFKTNLFLNPTVVLIGHEGNKFLFENEGNYFSDGMSLAVPTSTKKLMGSGALVMQMGKKHKENRRIIYQALQTRSLDQYIPIIESQTVNYLKKWATQKTFKWHDELKDYSLAIATECFLSINIVNSDKEFSKLYTTWGKGLLSVPIDLPFTNFGKALKCRELLLKRIGSIISSRTNEKPGNDLLGNLLVLCKEKNITLSSREIQEQLLTLLFAGHDTLSSALTSFCQLISKNPKLKEKLYEEQKWIGDIDILTSVIIKEMTYLDQVIKEVLRFAPPTNGPPRKVLKDCSYKGYIIPKDWNILYSIGQTQRDETVYRCPYEFNPDNFDQQTKRPAMSYLPFGSGSRECVGKEFAILEIKILAIHLIRKYEWEVKPKQSFKKILLPAVHPRDGLIVEFWEK